MFAFILGLIVGIIVGSIITVNLMIDSEIRRKEIELYSKMRDDLKEE